MIGEESFVVTTERPQFQPAQPEWLRRRQDQQPANVDRNLNDCFWRKPCVEGESGGWIIVGPSYVIGHDGRYITRQAENWERRGYETLPISWVDR